MSVVTNTLLLYCGESKVAFKAHLDAINCWFETNGPVGGLVSVDDPKLPTHWYDGSEALTSCVAIAAFNHLDVEQFLAFLREIPWTAADRCVQVLLELEQGEDFQLHSIFPVARVAESPERDRLLAEMETVLTGTSEDWFYFTESEAESLRLDELCRDYLATRGWQVPNERAPLQ